MSIDWSILHWVRDVLTCPFLDFLMPKLILLSNGGAVWLLAVGMLVGNVCLKNLIARPRPCWLDSSVRLLIADPTDYSFPSGHTLSSVIGAASTMRPSRSRRSSPFRGCISMSIFPAMCLPRRCWVL